MIDSEKYYNAGYADGLTFSSDRIDIEYKYHVHTGNDTSAGGCYIAQNVSQTCNCRCDNYGKYIPYDDGEYYCTHCRHPWNWHHSGGSCNGTIQVTTYVLGCGKTEETIEQAIVNFN